MSPADIKGQKAIESSSERLEEMRAIALRNVSLPPVVFTLGSLHCQQLSALPMADQCITEIIAMHGCPA